MNLANPEPFAKSFTHPNLYHKTVGINSMMNEYRENSGEHAWLKLVATKSTWTLFNPRYSPITTVYASSSWITRFYFTKKLCSIIGSIIFMSSRVLSPHYKHPHHLSATRDDKVNDCGSKFSASGIFYLKKTRMIHCNSPKFYPSNS